MISDLQKMQTLVEILRRSEQMRNSLQQVSEKLSPEASTSDPDAFEKGLEEMALVYEELAADLRHIAEGLKTPA